MDINERRQFSFRISELQSKCDKLIKTKDELSGRLDELNKVADQLINEKRHSKLVEPGQRIDPLLPSIGLQTSSSAKLHQHSKLRSSKSYHHNFSSFPQTDLNIHDISSSSSLSLDSQNKQPSNAFKLSISHCLLDVVPKADEIARLTNHLYN